MFLSLGYWKSPTIVDLALYRAHWIVHHTAAYRHLDENPCGQIGLPVWNTFAYYREADQKRRTQFPEKDYSSSTAKNLLPILLTLLKQTFD